MESTVSKLWTRATFAKNCGQAMMTGGSSEFEEAVGGASCARSAVELWKQECEEGNIPEPYCLPGWRPSNKAAKVARSQKTSQYNSAPVIEEYPSQDFEKVEIGHRCPKCGSRIESQATRCGNCFVRLEWQFGTPQAIKRKTGFEDDDIFAIADQSRSNF